MSGKINVLLTGASGGVGYEAVKQLTAQKHLYNTIVFDLKNKRSIQLLAPYEKEVTVVYGDITNRNDVCSVTENVDIVIHLAALIPPVADEKPELAERVNVDGTKNLIECLQQNAPHAFLMYSSSISVYGDRIHNPLITTEDILNPSVGDAYAVTKIKCEELVRTSGLDWTIFRLTAIMGRHQISKLMFHMPLQTPMEIATTEDTARAFVGGIDKREQLNRRIFNLGGGPHCRIVYKDFLQRAFAINGLGKLNFPEGAFATHNFHCGYYADGDALSDIVDFRRDTIDTFFEKMKKAAPPFLVFFASIFKRIIKTILLRQSEPYEALQHNDKNLTDRFFSFKRSPAYDK